MTFNNQYKDLLDATSLETQKIMKQYPDFSSEKMSRNLALIKEGFYAKSLAV
jgi:hypothetical protein